MLLVLHKTALSFKNEIYRADEKQKSDDMISTDRFIFEGQKGEDDKYNQSNNFLDYF